MYGADEEAKQLSNDLFQILDSDRSGFLDAKELRRARSVLLARDREAVKEMASSLSAIADSDGDGKVSYSEWHDFVGSLHAILGRKEFISLVRHWLHGSGYSGSTANSSTMDNRSTGTTSTKRGAFVAAKAPAPKAPAAKGTVAQAAPRRGVQTSRSCPTEADVQWTASLAEGEADEEQRLRASAAVKIQSASRGTLARRQSKPMMERRRANIARTDAHCVTFPVVTIAMTWELLTVNRVGNIVSQIDADDVVDLMIDLRTSGIDTDLANLIMMHWQQESAVVGASELPNPEDISPEELVHLVMLLWENKDLSAEAAREQVDKVKEHCRRPNMYDPKPKAKDICPDIEMPFKLHRFRRLIYILSELMRIDEAYFLSLIVWSKTQSFEVPDSLAIAVLHLCMTDSEEKTYFKLCQNGTHLEADSTLLAKPISLSNFMKLLYKGDVIDSSGQVGVQYEVVHCIFARVHRQIVKLMEQRARALRWRPNVVFTKDAGGLVGKHELGILLEELHKSPPLNWRFGSPLHLAVGIVKIASRKLKHSQSQPA